MSRYCVRTKTEETILGKKTIRNIDQIVRIHFSDADFLLKEDENKENNLLLVPMNDSFMEVIYEIFPKDRYQIIIEQSKGKILYPYPVFYIRYKNGEMCCYIEPNELDSKDYDWLRTILMYGYPEIEWLTEDQYKKKDLSDCISDILSYNDILSEKTGCILKELLLLQKEKLSDEGIAGCNYEYVREAVIRNLEGIMDSACTQMRNYKARFGS